MNAIIDELSDDDFVRYAKPFLQVLGLFGIYGYSFYGSSSEEWALRMGLHSALGMHLKNLPGP